MIAGRAPTPRLSPEERELIAQKGEEIWRELVRRRRGNSRTIRETDRQSGLEPALAAAVRRRGSPAILQPGHVFGRGLDQHQGVAVVVAVPGDSRGDTEALERRHRIRVIGKKCSRSMILGSR
jgi:hypothetical protein